MAYFPRVVAGPIIRAREFLPSLLAPRTLSAVAIADSAFLILQGLVRKVVIADLLFRLIPIGVFEQPREFSAPELAVWLFAYAFTLYNDFAGYTLIARGVSGLFGIPLPANFNAPYFARTFSEFWRRWHITLSDWLRDYIYMPTVRLLLRRNLTRTHVLSIVLPPLFTMLVSALWHDLSAGMLLWGGLHAVFLIGERIYTLTRPPGSSVSAPRWRQVVSAGLVFALVALVGCRFGRAWRRPLHIGRLCFLRWAG
jgi:D-alanyl-lipoteichoic acid acyltransferase DltB (MBOAT superfamily)